MAPFLSVLRTKRDKNKLRFLFNYGHYSDSTYTCCMFGGGPQAIDRRLATMLHRMRCHSMRQSMWCPAQLWFSNFPSSFLCYSAVSARSRSHNRRYPVQAKSQKKNLASHRNFHGNGTNQNENTSSSMPAGMNLGFCDISQTKSTPADRAQMVSIYLEAISSSLCQPFPDVFFDVKKQMINFRFDTFAQWHLCGFFFS